ncbi:MAG: RloB domain-containing protein [Methylotenera sp.]|nr:RloB domain-containing protein [Methylotenera sp.]
MGSENLFHKNRERLTSGFARKSATRSKAYQPSRPHILIVCEDSKSSVFYFEAMANDLRLSAVNVRGGECGSAPSSVLEYAEKQYMQSIKDGDRYDIVYCVFDRDNHDSFETTVKQIKTLNANKKTVLCDYHNPLF